MYGRNKEHLAQFLASPHITGADEFMPNLYEKDGYRDHVLVSGGTAVDSYDAFCALDDESAATAHSERRWRMSRAVAVEE